MERNGIVWRGDIKDVMRDLDNDYERFGNISLAEYIAIKQNTEKCVMPQAYEEKIKTTA